MNFIRFPITVLAVCVLLASASPVAAQLSGYAQTNLVASDGAYEATITDPTLINSWGIANRPTANGLGGHFWLSSYGNGTSNQYVGDVGGVPIHQDDLKNMDAPPYTAGYIPPVPSGPEPFIPAGEGIARVTGQTFQQTPGFITTLEHPNGTITAPAKFMFATEDGVISSWTDNKELDGTSNWVGYSVPVIDQSAEGSRFYGITVSNATGYLYTADLGAEPGIKVFNADYSERFDLQDSFNPFAGGDGVQPGEYAPFNIQTANIDGTGNLLVTYQKTLADPGDPSSSIAAGMGELGEGLGRLAEYTPTGELVAIWDDGGLLNSPYGLAIAPSDFGPASGMLLVGNAGDGTIVAFDSATHSAVGYLRDAAGEIIHVDGLKGMVFGNGMSIGETDRLYLSAGPNGGADGLLASLSFAAVPEPSSLVLASIAVVGLWCARRRRKQRAHQLLGTRI